MYTYEELSAQLAEDISRFRKQADICKTSQRQRISNLGHMVRLIADDIQGKRGEIKDGEVHLNFSGDDLSRRLGIARGTILEYLRDLGSRNVRYYLQS
ncbi:hypothetical protein HYX08_02745 [Candidatus Woesearchaeota archaeon]|nr:hypothetical protein [Candidatus Woesearchaeota archaeon]